MSQARSVRVVWGTSDWTSARGTVEALALVRWLRVKISGGYGALEVAELGQDRLLQEGKLGMEQRRAG